MPGLKSRVAGWVLFPASFLACGCGGGEPAKPVGAPVEITPGMEKMKEEMIQAFKTKSLGKALAKPAPGKTAN
jgi:hypothetical protein